MKFKTNLKGWIVKVQTVILVIFLLCGQSPAKVFAQQQLSNSSGTTYYVDCNPLYGDDDNPGTEEEPWKTLSKVNSTVFEPGDKILFRAGGKWDGQLRPQGSGNSSASITIDLYRKPGDEGKCKPKIRGGGQVGPAGEISYANGGPVYATVYLHNQEYWSVNNLAITNKYSGPDSLRGFLLGVHVIVDDAFSDSSYIAHNVHLNGLDISDVEGLYQGLSETTPDFRHCGGILVEVAGTDANKPIAWNGVTIENCRVKDVTRTGIATLSSRRVGATGDKFIYWKKITIRNNFLDNIAGDGILVRNGCKALIEHNFVRGCNQKGIGVNVGIWPWGSKDTLVQYNEVCETNTTYDGQAFDDDDYCSGSVFQYNYSHDNMGGFMLICDNAKDTTVRYNISQNDGTYTGQHENMSPGRIFKVHGGALNPRIYNNTIYVESGMDTDIVQGHIFIANQNTDEEYAYRPKADNGCGKVGFYNNIIYNLGSGGYTFKDHMGESFDYTKQYTDQNGDDFDVTEYYEYDYNLFYSEAHPSSEPNDENKITDDPLFMDPNTGSNGRDTAGGYKLQPSSPAVNAGKVIESNGGMDYWGNPVYFNAPDIGAVESGVWIALKLAYPHGLINGVYKPIINSSTGELANTEIVPYAPGGKAMIPLRYVSEAFGANSISWDQNAQAATIMVNGITLVVPIGSRSLLKTDASGHQTTVTIPPDYPCAQIIHFMTYIPLRTVAEALDCSVDYQGEDPDYELEMVVGYPLIIAAPGIPMGDPRFTTLYNAAKARF